MVAIFRINSRVSSPSAQDKLSFRTCGLRRHTTEVYAVNFLMVDYSTRQLKTDQ